MPLPLDVFLCSRHFEEVRIAAAKVGLEQLNLHVLPLDCDRPTRGWSIIEQEVERLTGDAHFVVLAGSCLPTSRPPKALRWRCAYCTEHCQGLLVGSTLLDSLIESGAYVCTAGWLSQWTQLVATWGFDERGLQELMSESSDRIVLLDSGLLDGTIERLEAFGERVGLPTEHLLVGSEYLELLLSKMIGDNRLQSSSPTQTENLAAEYAMAMDIMSQLVHKNTEEAVVDGILSLCSMLFHPGKLSWTYPGEVENETEETFQLIGDHGFSVRVWSAVEELGLITLEDLAVPSARSHYISLALSLGPVFALAINNARSFAAERQLSYKLALEKERIEVTLRSIGDGVVVTDAQGHVTLINKIAEKMTGWTSQEARGQPLEKIMNLVNERTEKVIKTPIIRALSERRILGIGNNALLIDRKGNRRYISDSIAPVIDPKGVTQGGVVVFQDITQRLKFEKEAQRADRLSALGVLAGGLAHDFNNLLTLVTGNISLIRRNASDVDTCEALDEAKLALTQAEKLTSQLLTFSRGGEPRRDILSTKTLVKDTTQFAVTGTPVRVVLDLAPDLWSLDGDAGQLGQMLQNLLINAVEAMPKGGTIRVRGHNVELSSDPPVPLDAGCYVLLHVSDTGVGIPANILDSIFEPFFSTKNRSSGLGLATAFSIAQRHGGHLCVSPSDEGTTFEIYLPAVKGSVPRSNTPPPRQLRGGGHALIMDDDVLVLRTFRRIMRQLEWTMDEARHGEQAIELFESSLASKKLYDVVIVDLTVRGGMGGLDTLAALRSIDPDVVVIVTSGYSDEGAIAQYELHGFNDAIPKPFNIDLVRTVIALSLQNWDDDVNDDPGAL